MKYLSLLGFIFLSVFTSAQVSFSDESATFLNGSYNSGVAICVADMNGDGLDDIVHLDDGSVLMIEYQQGGGEKFVTESIGSFGSNNPWAMCVGDLDNSGTNEVLGGGVYDPIDIMTVDNENGSEMFTSLRRRK